MINSGKPRGHRFCPGQELNPVPPSSQPVAMAMSYNDPIMNISTIRYFKVFYFSSSGQNQALISLHRNQIWNCYLESSRLLS